MSTESEPEILGNLGIDESGPGTDKTKVHHAQPESGPPVPVSLKEGEPEKPRRNFLEFLSPSQCRDWKMPKDFVIAGDFHLVRGGTTVIAGFPGCGKSRLLVALAIAGATGQRWMDLEIFNPFRTMIIQAENGRARLKSEFAAIGDEYGVNLDDFIKITPPPPYGIPIGDPDFRDELRKEIEEFQPAILGFDPWNRVVRDDKQKDYRAAIDCILDVLPEDDEKKPAPVIVAHLRKRGGNEGRKHGRDLLQEISGSGMIGSTARSAFILEHASPSPDDDKVVFTCAKNNDGKEGASSAWHRRNGLFVPAKDFDLEEFFRGGDGGRTKIEAVDVEHALTPPTTKKNAAAILMESTQCGHTAAYDALGKRAGKRFADRIEETSEGLLRWKG